MAARDVIKRRVLYYDDFGGAVRWWDFAEVTTPIGRMYEPYDPGHLIPGGDMVTWDPEDEMSIIDEIRVMPREKLKDLFDGSRPLIDGYLLPRAGDR